MEKLKADSMKNKQPLQNNSKKPSQYSFKDTLENFTLQSVQAKIKKKLQHRMMKTIEKMKSKKKLECE